MSVSGLPGLLADALVFVVVPWDRASEMWVASTCVAAMHWIVRPAIFGRPSIALRARQATPHGDVAASNSVASIGACVLVLLASGCLSATPPKTPNQRAAERNAPHVVPPPPPDAGRTPRPAPAD